jgi:hypothetical protein
LRAFVTGLFDDVSFGVPSHSRVSSRPHLSIFRLPVPLLKLLFAETSSTFVSKPEDALDLTSADKVGVSCGLEQPCCLQCGLAVAGGALFDVCHNGSAGVAHREKQRDNNKSTHLGAVTPH